MDDINWRIEKLEKIADGQILFFELQFNLQEYLYFFFQMREAPLMKNNQFVTALNKVLDLPMESLSGDPSVSLKIAIDKDDFFKVGTSSHVLGLHNIFEKCMLYIPRLASIKLEKEYADDIYELINERSKEVDDYHFYRDLDGNIELMQYIEGALQKNYESWASKLAPFERRIDRNDYVPPSFSGVIEMLYKEFSREIDSDGQRIYYDWNFLANDYILRKLKYSYKIDATIFEFQSSILRKSEGFYNLFSYYIKRENIEVLDEYLKELVDIDDVQVRYCVDDVSSIVVNVVRENEIIPLSALSTGEIHILLVLLQIAWVEGDVYLKEIDVYLHPNLQSKFLHALLEIHGRDNRGQNKLFIETHSPIFLREMQRLRVENNLKYRKIIEGIKIIYRSKNGLVNKEIYIKENGDLTEEIPSGFSDHLTRLNMLRLQLLD